MQRGDHGFREDCDVFWGNPAWVCDARDGFVMQGKDTCFICPWPTADKKRPVRMSPAFV